jgi:hypothetical protein
MSSYWKVDDTMRIGQRFVSIPSENGLEYSPEQKIQIFVDPSTKFMSGQDSYLDFNFKIKLPSGSPVPTKLALDQMGGSALIKNIRIYDGSRGTILEELDSYSSLCSVRYDYDTDDSQRNFRALREGAGVHTPGNRGSRGTSQSVMADTLTSPYFKKVEGNQVATDTWTDDAFLTAKLCIPLHTGIFAQNSHIFPVMMTNGLYIEIDTPPAGEVLKQLDSVIRTRRTKLNPYFHSLNGSLTGADDWPANASTFDTFYVSKRNNLSGEDAVSKFPFVIGETFKFVDDDDITATSNISGTMTISEINLSANGLIEVKIDTARSNNGAGASAILSEQSVM